MLVITIASGRIEFGPRFSVSLQRTLRVPDDGRTYPLPPGLGMLPIHFATDLGIRLSAHRQKEGIVVPLYQREALWLGFDGDESRPHAVKVGIGGINAVSGEKWANGLRHDPQDYLVCPPQLWLDGINAGVGHIRQFVAVPAASGTTIENQLSDDEHVGGMQIEVFAPKAGRFPDQPADSPEAPMIASETLEMGMAAGGRITQKVYRDPYGVDTWDLEERRFVFVYLLNAEQYHALTGHAPPPTPIDARTYTEHGFPWFELYDEGRASLAPATPLTAVESIGEIGQRTGESEDQSVEIPTSQIAPLGREPRKPAQRR